MPRYRVTYPEMRTFSNMKECGRIVSVEVMHDRWFEFEAEDDENAVEYAQKQLEVSDIQGFHLDEIRHAKSFSNTTCSQFREEGSKPKIQKPVWEEERTL